jgi:phosphoribosylamine--glycine ligase
MQSDLLELVNATVDGKLSEIDDLQWDPRPSICVVMASEGYPGSYDKGRVISGIDQADRLDGVKVFHAGTKLRAGDVVSNGGRVLGVTALGETVPEAKLRAYQAVKEIRWDGAWCRKDIADKSFGAIAGG